MAVWLVVAGVKSLEFFEVGVLSEPVQADNTSVKTVATDALNKLEFRTLVISQFAFFLDLPCSDGQFRSISDMPDEKQQSNRVFQPGENKMEGLIIGLLSGAVGGNIAGGVLKSGMGTIGRSITGIAGGGILAAILGYFGVAGIPSPLESAGPLTTATIVGNLISGILGGGSLTAVLGMLKK